MRGTYAEGAICHLPPFWPTCFDGPSNKPRVAARVSPEPRAIQSRENVLGPSSSTASSNALPNRDLDANGTQDIVIPPVKTAMSSQ